MPASYQISFEDLLKKFDLKIFSRFVHLKEISTPSLEYYTRTHPTFTPHGMSHSEAVIEYINVLVPDKVKKLRSIFPLINPFNPIIIIPNVGLYAILHFWLIRKINSSTALISFKS